MNRLERRAFLLVAAAAAAVTVSGIELAKKHARYLAQKAAATFRQEDEESAREETA